MSYTTDGGRILVDGAELQLRGISHFGFNGKTLRPMGLWNQGWKEQIARIKSLGFNAVRVPFVPDTLHSPAGEPSALHPLNADLIGKSPLQTLDLWMAEADRQGLYVLLDFHSVSRVNQYFHPFVTDPADYGKDKWAETWNRQPYTVNNWLDDLSFVAQRYAHLPHSIGLDIFNEPRDRVRWVATPAQLATKPPLASWKTLVEDAAGEILQANPNLLIFVQGLGNANFDGKEKPNISINWGENFQPQAYDPLDIPADKLVLSPHSYGPDVFVKPSFSHPDFPRNLAADFETLWGRFQGEHAVVVGEFGGKYDTLQDKAVQNALVDYMRSKGMTSSFYWAYYGSGDTGNILADDLSVREDKMMLLRRLWGASPTAPVETPLTELGKVIELLERIEINTRARP